MDDLARQVLEKRTGDHPERDRPRGARLYSVEVTIFSFDKEIKECYIVIPMFTS